MSDIRVIISNKNKVISKILLDKTTIQDIVEANLKDIFGISLVASKYVLENDHKEIIDTLGLDENNQLVIIEYRNDKFGQVLNKGLYNLDYMKKNNSEFKILVSDRLGSDIAKEIVFPARIIVIGEDFNKYDEHAVSTLGMDISLIKYHAFKKDIVLFEQTFSSVKTQYAYNESLHTEWFEELMQYIMSLGDEISQIEFEGFVVFRRIKTFAYMYIEEGKMKLMIQEKDGFKPMIINGLQSVEKAKQRVLKSYEEN